MAVRLSHLVLLGFALVLVGATLTFAAQKSVTAAAPVAKPVVAPLVALVVPDVRGQAFVFAKGMLEDAGFAWRIGGGAAGYAGNQVVSQSPAAGTRVLDTGSPAIALRLVRGKRAQAGTPENVSPYSATAVRLADAAIAPSVAKPTTPQAKSKPAAKPVAKTKPAARPRAFIVAGAPREPLDELPLVDRANLLARWLGTHRAKSPANVRHFLYQNAWVVQGARFGWWRGADALRVLIAADAGAQARWGEGAKSAAVARAALVEVRTQSR